MSDRDDIRQQILTAYGLDNMTPTQQAAFDAYGRAVETERRNEAAFAAWIGRRFAEVEADVRAFVEAVTAGE